MSASKFFYFDPRDVSGKLTPYGNLDMKRLLPFVTDIQAPRSAVRKHREPDSTLTRGDVNGDEVEWPRREIYLTDGPRFASYRQKRTLAEKIAKALVDTNPITEKDMMADWVAHRMIVRDRSDADAYLSFLRAVRTPAEEKERGLESGVNEIGRSTIRFLSVKDHYDDKKYQNSPYRGYNVRVAVTTKGILEPVVREIQIIEHGEYWGQEICPNHPAFHRVHYNRKEDISRKGGDLQKFLQLYMPTLEKIFGTVSLPRVRTIG